MELFGKTYKCRICNVKMKKRWGSNKLRCPRCGRVMTIGLYEQEAAYRP